ncbi:unnamed protein product [Closterium sp. NIES-53]
MYLMTCTCPDLAYPLSVLARFVAPGRHRPSHWYATKRVAKYVAGTSGMGLVLGGKHPVTLTGFSDSSWADDAETRQSTQGYSFSPGTGAVLWQSTRASSVSGSSCEAEVYNAAMAAQELRWLTFLLTDLGERPRSPPVLFADNSQIFTLVHFDTTAVPEGAAAPAATASAAATSAAAAPAGPTAAAPASPSPTAPAPYVHASELPRDTCRGGGEAERAPQK